MASSRIPSTEAAVVGGQHSKSSKGKRPLAAHDDQSVIATREGTDTASSNPDFNSSHASGSSKLVSEEHKHTDDTFKLARPESKRDGKKPAIHGPRGRRRKAHDDPTPSHVDNITDKEQLYGVVQKMSETLTMKTLRGRNSSRANPIKALSNLQRSRSFSALSTLEEDRQTAGNTLTRSIIHTTGLSRSRSVPPKDSPNPQGKDATFARNTSRHFGPRVTHGGRGRRALGSVGNHPGVQSLCSEDLMQLMETMVALHCNPSSNTEAGVILQLSASDPSLFSNGSISRLTALLGNSNSTICVSAMRVLQSLASHDSIRYSFGKHVVPKALGLQFDPTTDKIVRERALSLLKELAKHDDVSASFSSTRALSKASTFFETATGADDTTRLVETCITSLSGYAATRAVYEDEIIPGMVALLGNTDAAIHGRAANILIKLVNEATTISHETILQMITLLNNPSENLSENTRVVLSAISCYDAIQNDLAQQDIVQMLISFTRSDLIHVQCYAMSIFTLMVDEENIRTVLQNKLLSIVSDLLSNDGINSGMLRLLLRSLSQFVQYDDLRGTILRNGTIYALACLRSSKRLPEDYSTFLSELIADENLALTFDSKLDDSSDSPVTSFHCLVGAQEAMERVMSEENALREFLNSHQITPQDYFVQAGFNEDLLDIGGGYLEEIYIYLGKEIEVQGFGMLDGLAELFQPFPCVLLTPGHSYRTSMPSALPLGFDGVILERATRHHQVLKLTSHSKEEGFSEPMDDGESTSKGGRGDNNRQIGGSAGGGGDRGSNKDGNSAPNKGRSGSRGGDDGEAGKTPNDGDDDGPSDNQAQPSVVETNDKTCPVAICYSHVDVYISDSSIPGSPQNLDKLVQSFNMHVELAITKVQPQSISLQFNRLQFYTKAVILEHQYDHSKIKVKVDSSWYPRNSRPGNTPAAGPTVEHTEARETTSGLGIAMDPKHAVSVSGSLSRKVAHADQTTKNLSRITAYVEATSVEWVYHVDDAHQQQRGLQVEDERLRPFVEFYRGKNENAEKPLRVELSGYWVSPVTPLNIGQRFFSRLRMRQAVPPLRNFCHLTCITLPIHLPQTTISRIGLDARMPSSKAESVVVKPVDAYSELGDIKMEGQVKLGQLS